MAGDVDIASVAVTLQALLDSSWLARRPQGRAVVVTRRGAAGLRKALGLDVLAAAPGCAARAS